jgi:polyphosphate kinase 2 (PPK2 family)
MKTAKLAKSYRIDDGKHFRLKDFDPADTGRWKSVDEAKEHLQKDIERMRALQDKLYAQDCWSLLLIFQAMDAAGKDGTINHVMSGVRPGVLVQAALDYRNAA